MKGLIVYVVMVVIGLSLACGIGFAVEYEFSSTASLIVFLALFFLNFWLSWLGTTWVMDDLLSRPASAAQPAPVSRS